MAGQLFTHYFLTEGIQATSDWRNLISQSDTFDSFRDGIRQSYEDLSHAQDPNEAQTEQDLIRPVLDLLGWTDYLPQQATTGHEDIPDHLLFLDAASKERAAATSNAKDRFRYAAVVEESKRLDVPLDAHDKDGTTGTGTPHGQILRYLSTAEIESDGRIRWGILTNGRVWREWQNINPEGGFDAVIGNPPWDHIELQEVEWFASRSPDLALAPTAAARRTGIQKLRDQGVPLAAEFDMAKDRADTLAKLIRGSGHYTLLGGGDINLYSLFVEQAMTLIKPSGLVGLLTPSGIYADKTAARFFQSVSTSGRVAGLFDPVLVDRSGGEERRVWPDRHHRQFDMTNDSHLFRTAVQLEVVIARPSFGMKRNAAT